MFRSLSLISTCLGLLAFAPMTFAQSPSAVCKAGDIACEQGQKTSSKDKTTLKATASVKAKAPKVGQSAKAGQSYQRSTNSRLSAPPKGQEYRVVNDEIVLADTKTKKIVKVLGPRATLEK